jgi:hypothetical protein
MDQRKPKLLNIERRKTVWSALSEFYLDTELSDEDLKRLLGVFAASGFGIDEIREIERNEVRPAIGVNLLGVAGVWSGFDEEWLCSAVIQRIAKGKPTWWQRLWLRDSLTERYWQRIKQLE